MSGVYDDVEAWTALWRLLDVQAMRGALGRSRGRDIGEVAAVRVAYRPGKRVDVHYRTSAGDAVVSAVAGVDPAGLARTWAAAQPAGRSGVSCDARSGAVIAWLPFDPYLPAVAAPAADLAATLGVPRAPARLVRYKPHARATLRLGDRVLKVYAREKDYERALRGLRARLPVRTATYAGCVPDLRLTAQRAVTGSVPPDARAAAADAGEAMARLQRAQTQKLPPLGPVEILSGAIEKATLIGVVAPELRDVAERLVRRLAATVPGEATLVPAHGDFHVDQLLRTRDGITILDLDDLCLAPPALDAATYVADVVRGRDEDEAAVQDALAPLLAGYGRRPADLPWHLGAAILTRATHPFQYQAPAWRERTAGMLAAAARFGPTRAA